MTEKTVINLIHITIELQPLWKAEQSHMFIHVLECVLGCMCVLINWNAFIKNIRRKTGTCLNKMLEKKSCSELALYRHFKATSLSHIESFVIFLTLLTNEQARKPCLQKENKNVPTVKVHSYIQLILLWFYVKILLTNTINKDVDESITSTVEVKIRY